MELTKAKIQHAICCFPARSTYNKLVVTANHSIGFVVATASFISTMYSVSCTTSFYVQFLSCSPFSWFEESH